MNKKRKLLFDWGISDHYGWGIYGFNLVMYGQMNDAFEIVPLKKPSFMYPLDPMAGMFISQKLPKPNENIVLASDDIFLTSLGNTNQKINKNKCRDIGVIFNEANPLAQEEIENLKNFEFIVTGSSWNSSALEKYAVKTRTVIQGVDSSLFRPAPKKFLRDKFVVFSGGKLEYRKGQDILLKAFSIFSSRHEDVVLVAAWRSPWEKKFAATINRSGICAPLEASDEMDRSIYEWVINNGVKQEQVILLDAVPNRLMPEVFREVDLAVFPNRCEAGTNLVAMEALASGVSCLISKNTGHLDIIKHGNCIPLEHQAPIKEMGTLGWGESSVEELVDQMEEAYYGRLKIDISAARDSMLEYSWENAINSMLQLF